ncbi:hypothetical protein [Variovorax sp. dw_308]|uniref:hypothetical protein n=1 Tax=Variovorax sp. dw_308 TaxID=2721546 RepID=UPI001C44461B|nr:hypothetical protein [Variovorax sp. dw_308]
MEGSFVAAVGSYPTAIFTALLGVVLIYWLLGMLGIVGFGDARLGVPTQLHGDGDADPDSGSLANGLVALGLDGVPFSVVVSLLVLMSWMVSCLVGMWVLPLAPMEPIHTMGGILAFMASLALGLQLTIWLVSPLRGVFARQG